MLDAIGALVFLMFLAAGLRLWKRTLTPDQRRQRVNVFLLLVLVFSFAAGFGQRELWPFSSWPLVAGTLDDRVTQGRIVAVDQALAEHDVDYRAWQPLSFDELMSWMDAVFPTLDGAAKGLAASYLLSLAERARTRVIAGQPIGSSRRFLGPFAAPYFILHPRRWTSPDTAPARQLKGLRYYHETWSLAAHARGSADVQRQLVFELPAR